MDSMSCASFEEEEEGIVFVCSVGGQRLLKNALNVGEKSSLSISLSGADVHAYTLIHAAAK